MASNPGIIVPDVTSQTLTKLKVALSSLSLLLWESQSQLNKLSQLFLNDIRQDLNYVRIVLYIFMIKMS